MIMNKQIIIKIIVSWTKKNLKICKQSYNNEDLPNRTKGIHEIIFYGNSQNLSIYKFYKYSS